jgi:CHAT domain-containing protein
MRGPSVLLLFLLSYCVFGQNPHLEKAATFLYTDLDSAYVYLSLAEKEEIRTKDTAKLLEVYTYFNAASIQFRNLSMLQQTLEKQTALLRALGADINTLSEGLYYKIYYWFDMGRYHYILNDYETAIPFFYRIVNDIENNPEPSVAEEYAYFLTSCNNYLATMFRNQMKYEVAEEFYEENLRLHQKFGHEAEDILDTKNLIASLQSAKGNFNHSNKLAREAIEYYLKTDPDYFDISFLSTSALLINNYLKMKQADSAKVYLDQALPYAKKRQRFSTDYLYLQAKLAILREKNSLAFTMYSDALQTLRSENRNGDEQAGILKEMGDLFARQNDMQKAVNYYTEALELFRPAEENTSNKNKPRAKNLIAIFPVLNAYNQLLVRTNSSESYKKALNNGLTSIDFLNQLKKTVYTDNDKQVLVNNIIPILETSIEACFQLAENTKNSSYLDTAFTFFEQSKSPILLDAISRNNANQFSGIPDSLLQKERILKVTITALEKDIQFGEVSENSSLFNQKRTYEKFISQLETDYPSYYDLKYETNTVALKQLQQSIPSGTTVLSYFYGTKDIYVLAITENSEEFIKIAFTQQDVQNLLSYQKQLGDPGSDLSQLNIISNALYKKLLAPFVRDLPLEQLLIIPDGLLRTVPFEALNTSLIKASYLIETTACSYANSATLWYQLQTEPGSRQKVLAFAPNFEVTDDDELTDFLPLPNNVQEIQRLEAFFQGDFFYNEDASAHTFKEASKDHSIIHLATHAVANDETPEYSFLAFTPNKTNDYLLYVNDIYALDLAADLVTLSACETGVGTLKKGEGAISLARAFFYSGAKSLVYTLWNINDASSTFIMGSFYEKLTKGMSKDMALQDAKLAFLKENGETALVHPYYWSGFIIQGNTLPLIKKTNTLIYWFVPVFFLAILWFFRKKLFKLAQ